MSDSSIYSEAVLKDLEKGIFIHETLEQALLLNNEHQQALFQLAREKRDHAFPERNVEVRSVIEISNICKQRCRYCSMGEKMSIKQYTIEYTVLLSLIKYLYHQGRRVLLLQSGENDDQDFIDMVSRCLEKSRGEFADLKIILCLGNLSKKQYLQLKRAGADRYILKFESSNPAIYNRVKPNDTLDNRLKCMDTLLETGFSLGSGNIIGLPGQQLSDLADDLLFIHRYQLDMNSTTVFIPAEKSAYRNKPIGDINTTLNAMALMRIMNPQRLMPTTSSLEKAKKGGQLCGLLAGANSVTIHDGTPEELKPYFPIYSVKRLAPQEKHFTEIVEKAYLKFSMDALYD